jgi:hypothetical protein
VKLELPHVIREIGNGGADADLRRRGGVLVAGLVSKGAPTSAHPLYSLVRDPPAPLLLSLLRWSPFAILV